MTIKPLLAATVKDVNQLKYPLLASPKIDGIRCLIIDGKAVSRSLKPIPNFFIREQLTGTIFEGLDGEITLGGHATKFQETTSGVMSREGAPDFTYWVFDCLKDPVCNLPFHTRLQWLMERGWNRRISILKHVMIHTPEELLALETKCLAEGFEGVMLRDPNGRYKYGRSTLNEGILLKLKRFKDEEATIVDFEERMHNDNEATISELGYTKRSAHIAGKRPAGDLGALVCRSPNWQGTFKVGSGFDSGLRIQIWNNKQDYLGKLVKFKHLPHGAKDLPRHPIFLGFRDPADL